MYDVLIVYENKAREIENACLLATELEYRGYTVDIRNVLSLKRYLTKARLVIAPHLYNDFQVIAIAKNIWCSHRNIIDLQYEQILADVGEDDIHDPKEQAVYAQHIAWGPAQLKRYIRHGIEPKNIHMTGHIAMDLLRPAFSSYFYSKGELANEFGLDVNKIWVLFISSFSYANCSQKEIAAYEKLNKNANVMAELSTVSKAKIVDWLKSAAKANSNMIFIYRRHPAEACDESLIRLECELANFKCIDEYSVRQWVKTSDKLYTWLSTSIIDAFFCGKTCAILRPVILPENIDAVIMKEAEKIICYDAFIKSLLSESNDFPISRELIQLYYGDQNKKPAYLSICDLSEEMICSEKMSYEYRYGKRGLNILNCKRIIPASKILLVRILFDICTRYQLSKTIIVKKKPRLKKQLQHFEREGFLEKETIIFYKSRFMPVIEEINSKKEILYYEQE